MRKIYGIGVGGSGAKCLEAAIFLQALGLYGDCELKILRVDADASNGNTERTGINFQTTLETYQVFKQGNTPFMAGGFADYGIWNPLADITFSTNLERIFNKPALQASALPLAKLFDALYSPAEQTADLNVGFRGRPPIGSAVMSRLELDNLKRSSSQNGAWSRLFNDLKTDLGVGNQNEVVVHFFGSIFGGTGASGVPTLAKLVANELQQDNLRARINASLLLPYFGFDTPEDGDQTVFAETRFFALNTQAALQYLTEQSEGIFDSVYLVGEQNRPTYRSCTGGRNQENAAHFVELYAALAVNHGLERPLQAGQTQTSYISRANADRLVWTDLPDSEQVKERLSQGVRFAYGWFYNFALELQTAQRLGGQKFAKGAPWFRHYFALKSGQDDKPLVSEEPQTIQAQHLTLWSSRFLQWIQQVASAHHQREQLFQLRQLDDLSGRQSYREHLHSLVLGQERSAEDKKGDRLDTIKNQLADQGETGKYGVFGLAHALFDLF